MRNALVLCGIVLFLLAGMSGLFAADNAKAETVTKSGVVEIKKAEKGEKYDTVMLKAGAEVFKLLPGKDKAEFAKIEALAGKTIEVTGSHLPANPPKYPMAAIKVESFKEVAPPAAPATTDAPAAAPTDAPAAAPTDAPAAAPTDAPAATDGN
jgi:hypothetical protein